MPRTTPRTGRQASASRPTAMASSQISSFGSATAAPSQPPRVQQATYVEPTTPTYLGSAQAAPKVVQAPRAPRRSHGGWPAPSRSAQRSTSALTAGVPSRTVGCGSASSTGSARALSSGRSGTSLARAAMEASVAMPTHSVTTTACAGGGPSSAPSTPEGCRAPADMTPNSPRRRLHSSHIHAHPRPHQIQLSWPPPPLHAPHLTPRSSSPPPPLSATPRGARPSITSSMPQLADDSSSPRTLAALVAAASASRAAGSGVSPPDRMFSASSSACSFEASPRRPSSSVPRAAARDLEHWSRTPSEPPMSPLMRSPRTPHAVSAPHSPLSPHERILEERKLRPLLYQDYPTRGLYT